MTDARICIINTNGSIVIVGDFSTGDIRIYRRNIVYSYTNETLLGPSPALYFFSFDFY